MPAFKYALPVPFDGFETVKVVDVSAYIADARDALWCLYDIDGTQITGVVAPTATGAVTLEISPALALGNYKLVGIQ